MKPSRWIVAIGAMVAASPALAQHRTGSDEIVVTAPLEGSRIESLQGVDVLRRADVVEQLTGGLGETVAALPGVASTFFGAGASRPVIRGLGEDRVRILQNGIGAIDASAASPDHAVSADGLDAERIEVLRGAAALAYGGNAVGGVINVIDQSIPTRAPENGFEADALLAYTAGDDGTQLNLGAVFGAGALVLRADVADRQTENYEIAGTARSSALIAAEPLDPLAPSLVEQHGEAPNSFTGYRTWSGGASWIGGQGFAGLAIKRTESTYGLAPEEAGVALGGRIELEQTRVESRGDAKVSLGVFDRLDYGAQWSDYTHREIEAAGDVATTFTNEGFELRLEAHHGGMGDKLDGAVGLQTSDTDFAAVGEEAFLSATTTTDLGVFAVERLDFGGWGLEGGARYEWRTLDNVLVGEREFDALSASAGAFWRPAPNWFAGATLARTERAPTGVELFADGPHVATRAYERGDPALEKETALTLEGSVRYADAKRRFEINLYRAGYEDFMALVDSGLVFVESTETFENPALVALGEATLPLFTYVARDATFTGGEISVGAELFTASGVTVSADGAVDYVRAEFDAGGDLPRIPPRTTTVGVEAAWKFAVVRAEVVDVAQQDDIAAFESATDGYTLFNARLTLSHGERVKLLLDGRNLTDEEAREHVSFLKDVLPRPGRSVRVALVAGF